MSMRLRPRRLVHDSGQALAEYALILALASLGIVSALILLQGSLGNSMQASGHQIDAAAEGRAGEPPGQPTGGTTGAAGPRTGGGVGGEDGGYDTAGPVGHSKGMGNSGNGNGNRGPNSRK
jgi:Flp pilus assembly pilin Flp